MSPWLTIIHFRHMHDRNFPLIFQWACTLLIVICTSLLRLLDKHQPPAAPHNVNQKPSKAQIVAALFHRILFYQVPPRPFWMHLTSGMSLVDLLVYFSWLGLAAVWLYQTNMNAWAANDAAAIDAGWSLSDLALQRIYSVGVNFGVAVRGCLILLFYPVSRSNFLHWLFGVDFYTVVKYHKWFGIGTICLIWAHGLTLMIYWGAQGTWAEETFQYQAFAESNLAGFLAAAVVTVTFASSLEWFRRSFFHFWKKLHVFSAFAFLCLAFMHEVSWQSIVSFPSSLSFSPNLAPN